MLVKFSVCCCCLDQSNVWGDTHLPILPFFILLQVFFLILYGLPGTLSFAKLGHHNISHSFIFHISSKNSPLHVVLLTVTLYQWYVCVCIRTHERVCFDFVVVVFCFVMGCGLQFGEIIIMIIVIMYSFRCYFSRLEHIACYKVDN